MKGKLNDIRIYNHTLSKKEVLEVYKRPLVQYDFDEDTGYASILDNSGNQNTGLWKMSTTMSNVNRGVWSAIFDGIDDYIEFQNPKTNIISDDFSIAFSVYSRKTGKREVYFGDHQLSGGISFNIERNTSNQLRVYVGGSPDLVISACTIPVNEWTHIAITYNKAAKTLKIYKNGAETPVYTNTSLDITLTKGITTPWRIGRDSRSGTSSLATSETPFYGYMSYFYFYPIALNASDCVSLVKSRIQIARDGSLFVNSLAEHGTDMTNGTNNQSGSQAVVFDYKMNANVNGISEFDMKNKFDGNVYFEPDGSAWVKIAHHNNPGSVLFASSNDFANSCYLDVNRWFNGEVCNYLDKWELLVKQKQETSSVIERYRWIQSKNPMNAAFADVDAADITPVLTSGPHNIPSTYQEIEYIQATGTQFINTGYTVKSNNFVLELDAQWTGSTASTFATYVGFMPSANSNKPRFGISNYSSKIMYGSDATLYGDAVNTTRHKFVYTCSGGNSQTLKVDSSTFTDSTAYNFASNTLPMYLFARNKDNAINNPMHAKIFSFKLIVDGIVVRNMIPVVRRSDSVIGMYDTANGVFYVNSGSGTFNKGVFVEGSYDATNYGGLYKKNNSTYLCGNNANSGNWWGAVGSWSQSSSKLPGWNGKLIGTGYLDLYVRIDNATIVDSGTNFKSFDHGTVYAKNIIEY